MKRTIPLVLCAALALGACSSGKKGEPLPSFVDAADRSRTCAEAVAGLVERRVAEAADPAARQFAQARLDRLKETPPTPGNSVCYVVHVEEDGDLTLNGIYTNESYVTKTLRLAKFDPRIAYTYFRVTNPPGEFSRTVVFSLSQRLQELQIEGGLMTKFDAEIRGGKPGGAGGALPE